MTFNTSSFIAGVGAVVVVLSTGFAGGYFLADPTHINPPNRLQRLAAEDHTAPAPTAAKPEVVAVAAPTAAPASPDAAPTPVTIPITATAPSPLTTAQQPATPQAASTPRTAAPADVKAPEPVHTAAVQETGAPVADKSSTPRASADADKERAPEARFVERKRSETRKIAEQQRKQRELEVATVAVRRIIHDRDAPDVTIRDRGAMDMVENDPAEAPAPHFNLFGR